MLDALIKSYTGIRVYQNILDSLIKSYTGIRVYQNILDVVINYTSGFATTHVVVFLNKFK